MLGIDDGLNDGTAEALGGRLGKINDDGISLGALLGIDDSCVDGLVVSISITLGGKLYSDEELIQRSISVQNFSTTQYPSSSYALRNFVNFTFSSIAHSGETLHRLTQYKKISLRGKVSKFAYICVPPDCHLRN